MECRRCASTVLRMHNKKSKNYSPSLFPSFPPSLLPSFPPSLFPSFPLSLLPSFPPSHTPHTLLIPMKSSFYRFLVYNYTYRLAFFNTSKVLFKWMVNNLLRYLQLSIDINPSDLTSLPGAKPA